MIMAAPSPLSIQHNLLLRLYASRHYSRIAQQAPEYRLHYDIVRAPTEEAVVHELQEGKYEINRPDEIRRISNKDGEEIQPPLLAPLALAILMGRKQVVRALCDRPEIDLRVVDAHGWTLLQHAIAQGEPEILACVERALDRAKKEGESRACDRYPSLRKMVDPRIPGDAERVARIWEKGQIRAMTQREFREKTGASFYDGVRGTPASLFCNWNQPEIKDPFASWIETRYQECRGNPPPLFLCVVEGGWLGVKTEQGVKKGQMVCLLGAELSEPASAEEKDRGTSFCEMTTQHLRNYAADVTDGFPNVAPVPLRIDGVRLMGLVALRDIKPGELLLQHCGRAERVKWEERVELAKGEILQRFPGPGSLSTAYRKLLRYATKVAGGVAPDHLFRFECQRIALRYLVQTPSILLSLLASGHLSLSDVRKIFAGDEFCLFVELPKGDALMTFYQDAFQQMDKLQKADPKLRSDIAGHFERHVRAAYFAMTFMNAKDIRGRNLGKFEKLVKAANIVMGWLERNEFPSERLSEIHGLSKSELTRLMDEFGRGAYLLKIKNFEEAHRILQACSQSEEVSSEPSPP
jgi:hypothetical protein